MRPPNRHQVVPHGGFTDPEYASVGCLGANVPYAGLDRAVIDERTEGFCKRIVSSETHRLLGAHIVGEQALEAIQLIAGGMAAGVWVEPLAELELAYPTYTALTLQLAAGFAVAVATIWLIPFLQDAFGWRWAFAFLAPGPALGILAMLAAKGAARSHPRRERPRPRTISRFSPEDRHGEER